MTPRRKELRLALVCYGGVSLAVYMHGNTKELWKLLRASEACQARRPVSGDSESIWRELLAEIGAKVDLSVVCDIMSGASAGGINAILLARAITEGHDMEPLRSMWLDCADVDRLLDPDARSEGAVRRMTRFYKEPIAWWLGRRSPENDIPADSPEVRMEVATKLARFIRSRWFEPPFSGAALTAMLDDAMLAMADGERGPRLLPPGQNADLIVTATDYWGRTVRMPIHSPPSVEETEHRRLLRFSSDAPPASGRNLADRPALLLAARATASFPGAFPPAEVREIDERLAARGEAWPLREAFLANQLPGDRPIADLRLIDGSVLNNAPFGPALAAIRNRPATHEVDRRFVYIDPKPGMHVGPTEGLGNRPPGFFTAIMRALADIPREQPIRDNLEDIAAASARVRRIGAVIEGMTPAVDAAIARSVGPRFFFLRPTVERLRKARSRFQGVAAREAGFAYAGYAELKLGMVLDDAVALLLADRRDDAARIRRLVADSVAARGAFPSASIGPPDSEGAFVQLLRDLDLGFRIRRLRFVLRRLTARMTALPAGPSREAAEKMKSALYGCIGGFSGLREKIAADPAVRRAAESLRTETDPLLQPRCASQALAALAAALSLSRLDAQADAILIAAGGNDMDRDLKRELIRSWLGFPFYDIALLPLMQDELSEGYDELKVDRISPDDSGLLRPGGTRASLKGWQMNAFAAFFSLAYRQNDYLWGRLHAADRLFDILMSSARAGGFQGVPEKQWKKRLFTAILHSERQHLTHVQPLLDELEGVLATWTD